MYPLLSLLLTLFKFWGISTYIFVALQSPWLDFINLLEPFDFLQCVFGPTNERGHNLDLILSLGFSVSRVKITDTVFSDCFL